MSKPSECKAMVAAAILMREPFFLSGGIGLGKSQTVAQVCATLGYEFVDVRLSQSDPTDIKGFPCPDQAKGVMRWLPAGFLPPMKAKTKGIIFLDELNSAPQSVQAAAYQLCLDFRVGDYILPPGWTVGAAGNRRSDRSIVNQMPAALANRFIHIDFEADLEDFAQYARTQGVSDVNIAFLRFKEKLLHSFDPAVNPTCFPTPRAWFKVDKIMKQGLPSNVQYDLIRGTVGEGAAIEHKAYLKTYLELPTIDEIKVAPDTTEVPTSPDRLHALTTTLATATAGDKKAFNRYLQYIERMDKEWQVVYIRDVLKTANDLKFAPEFTKWSIANSDVVL